MTQEKHSVNGSLLQRLPRRTFLRGATALGTAAFCLHDAHATRKVLPYTPRFFTADEYAFIDQASEHIFPRNTQGPGARDLGVAAFIDRQMNTPYAQGKLWYMSGPFLSGPPELGYQLPYAPYALYRKAIASLNTWCMDQGGREFIHLPPAKQKDILGALERNEIELDDIPGAIFFEQLRSNTLEGAFADPLYGGNQGMGGWIMMGFPGARADFMDWINQDGAPYPFGPVSIPVSSAASSTARNRTD